MNKISLKRGLFYIALFTALVAFWIGFIAGIWFILKPNKTSAQVTADSPYIRNNPTWTQEKRVYILNKQLYRETPEAKIEELQRLAQSGFDVFIETEDAIILTHNP